MLGEDGGDGGWRDALQRHDEAPLRIAPLGVRREVREADADPGDGRQREAPDHVAHGAGHVRAWRPVDRPAGDAGAPVGEAVEAERPLDGARGRARRVEVGVGQVEGSCLENLVEARPGLRARRERGHPGRLGVGISGGVEARRGVGAVVALVGRERPAGEARAAGDRVEAGCGVGREAARVAQALLGLKVGVVVHARRAARQRLDGHPVVQAVRLDPRLEARDRPAERLLGRGPRRLHESPVAAVVDRPVPEQQVPQARRVRARERPPHDVGAVLGPRERDVRQAEMLGEALGVGEGPVVIRVR